VNLADVKRELRARVVDPWDGRCLDGRNGAPDLRTPERLAKGIWDALGGRLGGRALCRVRLVQEPHLTVDFRGGSDVDVTRTYEFSASHRLHSAALTEEENRRVFGKCNNPAGHGHNYVLQVTLRGEPGESGEVVRAAEVDRIVGQAVVDRWDHRNLNEDLSEFAHVNPTAEEIVRVAWGRLEKPLRTAAPGARLHRLKLLETPRNHVEYFGPGEEDR
jgi:6-pyruvoyltetrahydropterin/6-carboxytetrahydropterin synthase